MHWSEINPNPDHPEVVNYRNEKVSASYKNAVDSYEELIKIELREGCGDRMSPQWSG